VAGDPNGFYPQNWLQLGGPGSEKQFPRRGHTLHGGPVYPLWREVGRYVLQFGPFQHLPLFGESSWHIAEWTHQQMLSRFSVGEHVQLARQYSHPKRVVEPFDPGLS
jgi:hypothetical protein